MSPAPFRAVGGAVLSDHGVIALAEVRALVAFYAAEAASAVNGAVWRRQAAERARALELAVAGAESWRRAAGWADPGAADQA
ncbi:MAG TPA: hypothetical protein VGI30_01050 [Caulobacteraceae bacterium]|jgi:hypothetical protein